MKGKKCVKSRCRSKTPAGRALLLGRAVLPAAAFAKQSAPTSPLSEDVPYPLVSIFATRSKPSVLDTQAAAPSPVTVFFVTKPQINRAGPQARPTLRVWLACFCLLGSILFAAAQSPVEVSGDLNATALLNCIRFTSWPASAFASAKAPLVIGIVGPDPFGKQLDELVAGEVVHNRSLIVKRLPADADLRLCHAVFVAESEREHLPALLQQLKGNPVLTVSALNGFAQQGGMIHLLQTGAETKLVINQTGAEKANLQISGKLLSLATIVPSP